jgi:hypothetical protein
MSLLKDAVVQLHRLDYYYSRGAHTLPTTREFLGCCDAMIKIKFGSAIAAIEIEIAIDRSTATQRNNEEKPTPTQGLRLRQTNKVKYVFGKWTDRE